MGIAGDAKYRPAHPRRPGIEGAHGARGPFGHPPDALPRRTPTVNSVFHPNQRNTSLFRTLFRIIRIIEKTIWVLIFTTFILVEIFKWRHLLSVSEAQRAIMIFMGVNAAIKAWESLMYQAEAVLYKTSEFLQIYRLAPQGTPIAKGHRQLSELAKREKRAWRCLTAEIIAPLFIN